jgi:Protein of unknown function (DUF2905)
LHIKDEILPSAPLVGHSTGVGAKPVESEAEAITMQLPACVLVVVGVLIAVIGLVWLLAPSIPWLGKLPGDIAIERENFRFYLYTPQYARRVRRFAVRKC